MQYLVFLFAFVFGTIIGSFLNVAAYRFKTGRGVGGRSFCFSCGKNLGAMELIPVLSFLFQSGRCKSCRTPISKQYPIIELLTGLIFALIIIKSGSLFWFLLYASVFSVMIVIAVYDFKHKIIPDSLALCVAILGLISMLQTNWHNLASLDALIAFLAGPLLFLPFFLLWLLSRGLWIGLGDAKLSVGIGWLLGLASGVSALIIGIWIAAAWSLLAMAKSRYASGKKLTLKSEVPLAPFLILGTFIAFLFSPDIFNLNTWIDILFR